MPFIEITMRDGRTTEQIRDLVAGITKATATALDVEPDRVRILVRELPVDRIARGGVLTSDLPQPKAAS